jgi:Replication protein
LRDLTHLRNVGSCGYALGSEVEVRHDPQQGGSVAGLKTCGSVWACPCCSAKIALHRSGIIEQAITTWAARGNSVGLLTLTIQHHRGDNLAALWDRVSRAWSLLTHSGTYTRLRKAAGVRGFHRTVEVTYTPAGGGWHVHLHVLYFLDGKPGPHKSAAFGRQIIDIWKASVGTSGGLSRDAGQDWKILRGKAAALKGVAGYVSKGVYVERERTTSARGLAFEVARGDLKTESKSGALTPFEILGRVVESVYETGEVPTRWANLWHVWEAASKGRRQQFWSRGLLDLLGLKDQDLTDEEAAALEVVQGVPVVRIASAYWRRYFARDGRRHARLLQLLTPGESSDDVGSAVRAYLRSINCPYLDVVPTVALPSDMGLCA